MELVLFLCCLLCLLLYVILVGCGCAGSSLLHGLLSSFVSRSGGPSPAVALGLLVAVASLVVEHRL